MGRPCKSLLGKEHKASTLSRSIGTNAFLPPLWDCHSPGSACWLPNAQNEVPLSGHKSYRENQHFIAIIFRDWHFTQRLESWESVLFTIFFHELDYHSSSQVFSKRKSKLNWFNFELFVLDCQKDRTSRAFQVTGQRTTMIENYSK